MKQLVYLFILCFLLAACDKDSNTAIIDPAPSTGQGGSLARFTIAQNHLYVVDSKNLYTYSLENSAQPQVKSTVNIGMDIETIYAYGDKLFVGSTQAMYIYSISDANNPQQLGMASHVRSCDPVVAKDNLAYVTLRNGSTCGGTQNALLVYDVSYIMNPVLKKTISTETPYGLGIRNNRLYVCNGSNGLSVYDITVSTAPKLIRKLTDDTYYDVIPTDNLLICMVQGGTALYQYDNSQELVRAAKISN